MNTALTVNLVLQVLAHAKYVLGYVVLGPVALLLLADAVRVSGTLPGGHEIKTVTQSKWHRINLQVCSGATNYFASSRAVAESTRAITSNLQTWAHLVAPVPHGHRRTAHTAVRLHTLMHFPMHNVM